MILASQSPRRAELLRLITSDFEVSPADVDETPSPNERPDAYVERLALMKAQAIALRNPTQLVLAADTVVIQDGELLGKPLDEADAIRMLCQLSGRAHQVKTGVAVIRGQHVRSIVVTTRVVMRVVTDQEMRAYWHTGEPRDKAGGYGIQGLAARFIASIEGSYTNVVGLPLVETEALLNDAS